MWAAALSLRYLWGHRPIVSELLELARDTTRRAGKVLIDHYHRRHTVHRKSSDIDLVTEADMASEKLIVEAIRQKFPGHTILSEEGLGDLQEVVSKTECLWLVDPLDGTVNYAHGFPVWGVSMAVAERGQVIMGVIYDPLCDSLFWAERGQGAWAGEERIHVSDVEHLKDALVATGFAYKRATLKDNNLAEFGAVMPRVQGVRRAGAAVLDLAHLAAGHLDGYWEMHLEPWDWAAGSLLVAEAGGLVTDVRGEPWALDTDNLVASNGPLHQELLAVLGKAG
jgi:myo-inositol-1(or 4)-monophosphatase